MTTIIKDIASIYRSWWFDPFVASLSFFTSIMIYSHYELKEGKSCYRSWAEFLWGKGVDKNDARASLNMSLFAYWVGILIWVQIVPPPSSDTVQHFSSIRETVGDYEVMSSNMEITSIPDGFPISFESTIYLLSEVISGILLYDTIFFFIHYAMHECKFVACISRHFEHHKATKNLEARHVLRHSLIDGMLQVLVNIAVQRRTPWGMVKSRFGRILHNVFVTMMLTESHSASAYPNLFRWWCVGVREHRNHHLSNYHRVLSRNDVQNDGFHFHRYQQFFGHWDYLRLRYMAYIHQKQKQF